MLRCLSRRLLCVLSLLASFVEVRHVIAGDAQDPPPWCYVPIDGGWRVRLPATVGATQPNPPGIGVIDAEARFGEGHGQTRSGTPTDNPRLHRRPLYPPADRTMLFSPDELKKVERCGFRPLVLAYNEPRFLFDFHSAGGLLGHLFIGLKTTSADGKDVARWLHRFADLDVRYTDGRMEYVLRDPAFAGLTVRLSAIPMADSAGLIARIQVEGPAKDVSLIWAYGGASGFFTNYAFTAADFTFAPKHCARNRIAWNAQRFELRRGFEKSDAIMNEPFAVARTLPGWEATIRGGSSWKGQTGWGDPNRMADSPDDLMRSAEWSPNPGDRTDRVVVGMVRWSEVPDAGFIVVGMGGQISEALANPKAAYDRALARTQGIAERVVTSTPDPHLDAAVRMMAFATEGTWGDSAFVHGGWSWRFAYLGWRIWYGPDCYGWTDRVKKSIENHTRLSLVRQGEDQGALGSMLEYSPGVFYNMNEVFLDHVRQYFDYTNDIELMRQIFPILDGIVAWEGRRLQPGNEGLYESALNTWISDSHWYIRGQCTQASAYMLAAHRLLGDLAKRLGKDDRPYREAAQRIRQAMQQKLWMPRQGVFAEYIDTIGHRMLHPEPELPTIYHSAEFGAADPLQIHQMLHWADTHLRVSPTPGGGKQYWSSNWHPNSGRGYTHSTYELAYGEEMNFAQTNYLGGRADDAYALIRASLCGIFNGPTPGGLTCHSRDDGRQRYNDEFADASSMWARAVVEGLFGIAPKRPEGAVELTPQPPSNWSKASIRTPHFSYELTRGQNEVAIRWESPVRTAVRLQLPIRAERIDRVLVNDAPVQHGVEPGIGLSWLKVLTPPAERGTIVVSYRPSQPTISDEKTVRKGQPLEAGSVVSDGKGREYLDPQGVLKDVRTENGRLRGVVACSPGPAILYLRAGAEDCPLWLPVRLRVEAETPVAAKVWTPPNVPDRDLKRWALIDLSSAYNASFGEVLDRVVKSARPPAMPASQVGWNYWRSHLGQYHGGAVERENDQAWRNKVGPDGVAWTTDGIPFKTAKAGPNIGVVTLAGGYPARLETATNTGGKTLYLMLSGITFPAQSHVVNLRVTLRYADGSEDRRDLVNPKDIGDCWGKWCGRFHDTAANGFENLAGRRGPAGSAQVKDLTQPVATDTEAHLLAIDLKAGQPLQSIGLEAIANDVVFGIMGATILK